MSDSLTRRHGFGRVAMLASFFGAAALCLGSDPYRGLWVGEVLLSHVNEVSVPLDENNVPRAPDPKKPTATFDQASLRLILHVNGSGQVRLLKDVALLARNTENEESTGGVTSPLGSDSDVALVTDPRLYGEFPPQPASRWASAVFDFGDGKATEAVDAILDAAVVAAAASVHTTAADLNTESGRFQATQAAEEAAILAAMPRVGEADVAAAFASFLATHLSRAQVDTIAAATDPAAAASSARTAAEALRDGSFFRDTRGIEAVDAVVAAVQVAPDGSEAAAGQNAAAAFADLADDYHRFIAGKLFGDMIASGATAAAEAAVAADADEESITEAVDGNAVVQSARNEALTLRVASYDDTRTLSALNQVLAAVIASAVAALPASPDAEAGLQTAAEQAGREVLATQVTRFARPTQAPTPDYDSFVASDDYAASVETAAAGAAAGAVSERRNNPPPFSTLASLEREARAAAVTALQAVYRTAARVARAELPLTGVFGPGRGDPRLTASLSPSDPPLGAAALEGTILLAANHPTNPFRHRRHPDHTVGIEVIRRLRLDFDGAVGDPLGRAGFGVDRITGTYREELFGLHKPLGPNRDVGLRVEGKFTLQRLSLIDTLNAR